VRHCPQDGIYYVVIQHFGTAVPGFGDNAEYDLSVYRPIGIFISLLVKGIVKDGKTGVPIQNARILTNDNATAITLPNGSYKMSHPPGTWNFTVRAQDSGYPPVAYSGIVISGTTDVVLDFLLVRDTDDDGVNDAEDGCPDDVNKFEPGICGCGQVDVAQDTDQDGAADCVDVFPANVNEWLDTDADGTGNNADIDDDNDGVSDTMEASGPNGGDSNQDGVPDSIQNHVACLQANTGQGYVVIESLGGTTLSDCQVADNPSVDDMPADEEFPFGFFDFTISGIGYGGSTSLTITLPDNQTPDTYYKYGMTPIKTSDHWYKFLYDFETGVQMTDNVMTLYFVDALRGDDELIPDSMIIDLGGPGFVITDDDTGGDSSRDGGGGGGGGGGCFVSSIAL